MKVVVLRIFFLQDNWVFMTTKLISILMDSITGPMRLSSYGYPVVSEKFSSHEIHFPHCTELTCWGETMYWHTLGTGFSFNSTNVLLKALAYITCVYFLQVTYLLVTTSSLTGERSSRAFTQD